LLQEYGQVAVQIIEDTSINSALKTLQAIWSHPIKQGLFTADNPVANVERSNLPKVLERDYLEKVEVDELLRAAEVYGGERHVREVEARNVHFAIALMALARPRKREVCPEDSGT
jgi:hypothetical protein